jgi:glycerol 2-dehydrogenase (NADP+)
MTKDGKADKSHDWIDTWRSMEELYRDHPDKIKAIGDYSLVPLTCKYIE